MAGRKRFVLVDSLGLLLALLVRPADVQDRDGGRWLVESVRGRFPRLREVVADSGFSRRFIDWVRDRFRWAVTTPATAGPGFRVHPRRWVVERTIAWVKGLRRMRVRYDRLLAVREAVATLAAAVARFRILHHDAL